MHITWYIGKPMSLMEYNTAVLNYTGLVEHVTNECVLAFKHTCWILIINMMVFLFIDLLGILNMLVYMIRPGIRSLPFSVSTSALTMLLPGSEGT